MNSSIYPTYKSVKYMPNTIHLVTKKFFKVSVGLVSVIDCYIFLFKNKMLGRQEIIMLRT